LDSTTSVFHFFLSWCVSFRSIRTRDTHSTRAPILNIPTDTFAYFVSDMSSVRSSRAIYAALVAFLAFGACFAHATAAATSDTPTPRRSLQQVVAASRDAAVADATVTTEPTVADVSRHSYSDSSGCSSASIQKTGFVNLQTCSRDECCPGYTCSSAKVYATADFYAPSSGRRRSLLQEDLGRGHSSYYNSAVQTTHVETGYVAKDPSRYDRPVCCLAGPLLVDQIDAGVGLGSFDYAQATQLICKDTLDAPNGFTSCKRGDTIAGLQKIDDAADQATADQAAADELACLCCTGRATLRANTFRVSFWCNTKDDKGTGSRNLEYYSGECDRYV